MAYDLCVWKLISYHSRQAADHRPHCYCLILKWRAIAINSYGLGEKGALVAQCQILGILSQCAFKMYLKICSWVTLTHQDHRENRELSFCCHRESQNHDHVATLDFMGAGWTRSNYIHLPSELPSQQLWNIFSESLVLWLHVRVIYNTQGTFAWVFKTEEYSYFTHAILLVLWQVAFCYNLLWSFTMELPLVLFLIRCRKTH